MKSIYNSFKVGLTLVACIATFATERNAGAATTTNAEASENLGYFVEAGRSNKIARVFEAKPTYVHVILESGHAARKIPRNELPPELAVKFPYDAAKAAEYQKQQAELVVQQQAAQKAAARASSLKREQELTSEIERLNKDDQHLQSDITLARTLPRGNDKRAKITDKTNERQRIREQITSLQAQVDAIRAQR